MEKVEADFTSELLSLNLFTFFFRGFILHLLKAIDRRGRCSFSGQTYPRSGQTHWRHPKWLAWAQLNPVQPLEEPLASLSHRSGVLRISEKPTSVERSVLFAKHTSRLDGKRLEPIGVASID